MNKTTRTSCPADSPRLTVGYSTRARRVACVRTVSALHSAAATTASKKARAPAPPPPPILFLPLLFLSRSRHRFPVTVLECWRTLPGADDDALGCQHSRNTRTRSSFPLPVLGLLTDIGKKEETVKEATYEHASNSNENGLIVVQRHSRKQDI